LLIYPSGKFVVVKNYTNPSECFVYRGHSATVTCAKFAPNGYWVASADITGKVRVWSWDNPEHLTKLELPAFAAAVYDLDWDYESKKIVVCGDGSGVLVKCFTWDTGNSAGEMLGHNKRVLSVSYKPSRPFRVMSGGEDMRTVFYQGPPFKMDHTNPTHSNFVNCVRFAPNGSKVVSVGTDKKIQVYDGATGQPTIDVANAHDGGIYGVAFSPDSSRFVTASADKTLKVWGADSASLITPLTVSSDPQLGDAQVSVIWHKENIVAVSLNGLVNLYSVDSPSAPVASIAAHQTAVTAVAVDPANDTMYTGSLEGVMIHRDISGDNVGQRIVGTDKRNVSNAAHGSKVVGIAITEEHVVSVGWDDKIRWVNKSTKSLVAEDALNGQPLSLASSNSSELLLVVTNLEIALYRGFEKRAALAVSSLRYSPTCGAIVDDSEIAIGGSDHKTHIYHVSGTAADSFVEVTTIETRSAVSALSYNPTGDLLAIGDVGRQVEVYERGTWATRIKGQWVFHTSRITSLSWSPNGQHLASGSVDENIYIWKLESPMNKIHFPFTHSGGVHMVQWVNDEKLISVGNDHTTVIWKVPVSA
jgi:WD40 repeat protein